MKEPKFTGTDPLYSAELDNSTENVYNKLWLKKEEPYKVLVANDNTLHILQDGLKNTVSIHPVLPALNSRGYCNRPNEGEQEKSKSLSRSVATLQSGPGRTSPQPRQPVRRGQNTPTGCLAFRLECVLHLYGYSKAGGTAEAPYHIQ